MLVGAGLIPFSHRWSPTMICPSGKSDCILLCSYRRPAQKSTARKLRFDQSFQNDLGGPVPRAKIFRFPLHPNQRLFPRCPVSTRGAYRDRHERETGCGGRSSVRREKLFAGRVIRERAHRARRTARSVRQNRVVLTPVAGAKLSVANSVQPDRFSHQAGRDGGKTNSSPGRARHKPSNHCAGNAGVLRLYLYARVRNSLHHCTRDRGCSKHPAFPAPSHWGGKGISANLGRSAPRERERTSQ